MAYKEGFQKGQIPLKDFSSRRAAEKYQTSGEVTDLFASPRLAEYRKKGFTIGVAHANHRWYVVLNPPGVTSYE